jgi:SAM-dependent methyltransferase
MRRGDYGYDAPYALIGFAAAGALLSIAAVAVWAEDGLAKRASMFGIYGAFFLANALSFFYTTRHGKLHVWNELLDGLDLRGGERVLDMGCGRGAVLTAVARRLRNGRAIGVDLWSKWDQSGNSGEVTLRNATLEGVGDRILIQTGDMRALPFHDATFDVVVSSLAIHNLSSSADRERAVSEAWRVLRPGGRLVIADIRATARYAATLVRLGAERVERRGLGWRFWYGNPLAATSVVTASKAA